MPEQIKFAGEQGYLTLDVLGYERPASEDQDDANWLMCRATIKSGPFSGTFKCGLTTHDLSGFRENLKNGLATLSGAIRLQNTEEDIALDVTFDKRGGAVVICRVQPTAWPAIALEAKIDSDQSYLSETLRQLETVLRRFPVKVFQAPGESAS